MSARLKFVGLNKFFCIVSCLVCTFLSVAPAYSDELLEKISESDLQEAEEQKAPLFSPGYWSFQIGLGGGSSSFAGTVKARYNYNRWLASQFEITYIDIKTDDWRRSEWQFELPQILFIANPTMFVPFLGTGPGYYSWRQRDGDGTIDDNGSPVLFYFYGFEIRFFKNFALVAQMKTVRYVGDPPVEEVENRGTINENKIRGEKQVSFFTYGFHVSF